MAGELPFVVWSAALFNRSGYAEEARNNVLALDLAGVPVGVNPRYWVGWEKQLREWDATRLEELVVIETPPDFVHVMHVTPPHFRRHPAAVRHIGRTMWETDGLPPGWAERCNEMDEVWVPSEFNVQTFSRSGVAPEKLQVVPECLQLDLFDPEIAPLELPQASGFTFLAVFTWSWRKGWDVLVRAYVEEFAPDEDVTLFLKVQAVFRPLAESLAELRAFIREPLGREPSRTPRIVVLDSNPGAEGMARLYRAADAYVLPARGEGWGRPYMEAMAMGLPTIATRWSGNLAYMTDENSYLVDSVLGEVAEPAWREWPWFRGQRWAEPSVVHLRALMRRVFERRDEARAKGARAREDVRALCSLERVGGIMRARLEAAAPGGERRAGRVESSVTPHERTGQVPQRLVACVVAIGAQADARATLASLGAVAQEVIVAQRDLPGEQLDAIRRRGARVVALKREEGAAEGWNAAAERARGEWLLFLRAGETLDVESAAEAARLAASSGDTGYLVRRLSPTGNVRCRYLAQVEPRLFPSGSRARFAGDGRPRLAHADAPLAASAIVVHGEGWRPDGAVSPQEVTRLERLAAEPGSDPFHLYVLAAARHRLGEVEEAGELLRRAMARYLELPAEPQVLRALGNTYLALGAVAAERSDWRDTAGYAHGAIQLLPDVPEAFELLASAAANLGLLHLALRAYERAIACEERLSPAVRTCVPSALLGMASVHFRLRRWEDALGSVQRAERLRPDDPAVLAALARAYQHLGRPEEGAALLRRALDAARVTREAWLALAETYARQGRRDEAARVLQQALDAAPGEDVYRRALKTIEGR